ncbi:hypothetical protein FI667_g1939, partial [Globisporangium splendens]
MRLMRPEDRLLVRAHTTGPSFGVDDDEESSCASANEEDRDETYEPSRGTQETDEDAESNEEKHSRLESHRVSSGLMLAINTFKHQGEDLHGLHTLESHHHAQLLQIVDAFKQQTQDLHELFAHVKKERLKLVKLIEQPQEERDQDREQREQEKRDQYSEKAAAEDINERHNARSHQGTLPYDASEQDEDEEEPLRRTTTRHTNARQRHRRRERDRNRKGNSQRAWKRHCVTIRTQYESI